MRLTRSSHALLQKKNLPRKPRKTRHEGLENRSLLSVSSGEETGGEDWKLTHGGFCSCPICTGALADLIAPEESGQQFGATTVPLSSLPVLNSLAGSQYTLHLDFDGHFQATWGSWSNVTTAVFDLDGDATTFSELEVAQIIEVWERVAEDYAPFNINVTTVDPGNMTNGRTMKVAIGGSPNDWFGQSAGGVAYIDAFTNTAPNVAYVFSGVLSGSAKYIAEAASHEAGHTFGLLHQSSYSGTTKTAEYNTGNSNWAPIMGVGYYSTVTTWHNGANGNGYNWLQDDMAVISRSLNGFGYRADDYGGTTATAGLLSLTGTTVNQAGLIGQNGDLDYFRFTSGAGQVTFTVNVAQIGANLNTIVELRSADGTLITYANPSNTLGATLIADVTAGEYFLVVRGDNNYGCVGQYSLTGTVPEVVTGGGNTGGDTGGNTGGDTGGNTGGDTGGNTGGDTGGNTGGDTGGNTGGDTGGDDGGNEEPSGPEVHVRNGTVEITDGTSTVDFGNIKRGKTVKKTFTITNIGTETLSLQKIASVPRGFKLSNIKKTSLAVGKSTTFVVTFAAKTTAAYTGEISFGTNDANEAPFNFTVNGSVGMPAATRPAGPALADAALAKMAGGSANQQVLRVSRGLETAAAQSPRVQTLSTTSRNELHDTAIDQLQPDAADALASDLGESAYQQRMAAQLERLEHLVAEALDADLLG